MTDSIIRQAAEESRRNACMRARFDLWRWATIALLVVVSLFVLAGLCCAAEPFTAEGITVIDGDTIKVKTLHLGWGVALTNQTIRAADFDAWESSKKRQSVVVTDAEITKGILAANALRNQLVPHRLRIEPLAGQSRDVYGRLLGRWYIDDEHGRWVSLGELMKQYGHDRNTKPKPKP